MQGHQSDVEDVLQTTPSKKRTSCLRRLDKRFLITTFHYFHRFFSSQVKDCQNIPSFNMLMMGQWTLTWCPNCLTYKACTMKKASEVQLLCRGCPDKFWSMTKKKLVKVCLRCSKAVQILIQFDEFFPNF